MVKQFSMRKPLRKKVVYKGSLFTVTEETFKTSHGHKKTYERIYRIPSVYVLPMLTPNKILLMREWRVSQGKYLWRIPAGRVDKEQSLRKAAQRELQEETGYKAGKLRKVYKRFLGESIQAPAYVFLAQDLTPAPLPQDEDEKIILHPMSLSRAYDLAMHGEIGEELMALSIIRLYKKTL